MSRRNTELLLLIAGAFPVILLYAMYVINSGETLSFETLAVPIGLFAAFAAAHIAVRFLAPGADPAILPIVFVLSGIGITFVTRLAPDMAMSQLLYLFIGVALMVVTLAVVRNLEVIRKYKYTLGIIGVILLLLPMFVGTEINGSRLWITIGSFSIQPGEFAKIFIVLFIAGYLAENRELLSVSNHEVLGFKVPRLRLLLPLFLIWGLCLLVVVFERDLGSAVLFYTIFLVMLYVATGRVSYLVIGLILLLGGGYVAYLLLDHVQVRFEIWLDPFADAQGDGYQLVQSLYSLADGGLFGVGIGNGLADSIPVVESDFIFSAIGEELGLLGASAVLILYMLFAIRGFTTAARAKSDLAAFTAAGLTTSISFQAFLIVGGVTRLIPLTGVTLPFMSQGGSSLLSSFIIVGLLMRAGDEATGMETELAGTGVAVAADGTPAGVSSSGTRFFTGATTTKTGGSHARPNSRLRRSTLETPESGVLGRVALANRLTYAVFFFTALFAVLIGNLTYIQVFKAEDYQNMADNNHTITKAAYIQRGSIITSDGLTLVESIEQEDGTYERSYPNGSLAANVVGYTSTTYGNAGIEETMDDTLTGSEDYSTWESAISSLAGISQPGNSVQLTIDSTIQTAAEDALDGLTGAIVVLDPRTGAVLAWATSPSYDNTDIDATMAAINSGDTSMSLYDRATQALYSPGSTFKVATLAAALESGTATLDTVYDSPALLEIGGGEVTNSSDADYGSQTLLNAFTVSANTVFAQVAVDVGAETLVDVAEAFGYGQSLGQDFSTTASIMADPDEMTLWELAWAGAGQPVGEDHTPGPQTTIMQNAVMVAAIANDGVALNPYVVEQILSPEGTVISTTECETLAQVVSAETAAEVKEAMLAVVESGTGTAAQIEGVQVAGKTGTAQVSNSEVNSLFVGFAPYDTPTVAIAVVIEDYDSDSGDSAAAIAGTVLAAALSAQGS